SAAPSLGLRVCVALGERDCNSINILPEYGAGARVRAGRAGEFRYIAASPGEVACARESSHCPSSVLHLGLVETIPSADQQLSWLLVGTAGATQLTADYGSVSAARPSIGLGGGLEWMATDTSACAGTPACCSRSAAPSAARSAAASNAASPSTAAWWPSAN